LPKIEIKIAIDCTTKYLCKSSLEFRYLSRRNIAINVIPGKDKDIRLVGEDARPDWLGLSPIKYLDRINLTFGEGRQEAKGISENSFISLFHFTEVTGFAPPQVGVDGLTLMKRQSVQAGDNSYTRVGVEGESR
jgi:hypothetical protein